VPQPLRIASNSLAWVFVLSLASGSNLICSQFCNETSHVLAEQSTFKSGLNQQRRIRRFTGRREEKREAPGIITSASRATQININRTSLDDLLLGMVADIDKLSIAPIIKPLSRISKLRFLIRGINLTNRNLDAGVFAHGREGA
jgi:hypothetical protein